MQSRTYLPAGLFLLAGEDPGPRAASYAQTPLLYLPSKSGNEQAGLGWWAPLNRTMLPSLSSFRRVPSAPITHGFPRVSQHYMATAVIQSSKLVVELDERSHRYW